MSSERRKRAEDVFQAACDLPEEQRAAFLDAECRGDADLRAEVDALLGLQEQVPNRFLESPPFAGPEKDGAINERRDSEKTHVLDNDDPIPVAVDPKAALDAGTPLPPADAIPGYEILRELHRGGQGVVYQAIQKSTRRKVALKVMLEGPFAGPVSRRRFEREIELVGSLRHPAIVPIFDSGVGRGQFFYAMEYIRGQPLADYVRTRKLSIDDTLRLFQKVCEGLDYAHQRGVIHRDLKPQNILIDERGDPHVLDFGLAKIAGADATGETASQLVSVTGQVMGTLAYMSPEQAAGRPDQVDMRSDVYALGVMLYELLTGQFPYEVNGPMATVLTAIQSVDPKRPSSVCGARHEWKRRQPANDEIDTIILKALAKNKDRRYNTAGALGQDIGRLLAGEPIDAKRDSALYVLRKSLHRYRMPATVAAGFVLLVLCSSVVAWSLYVSADRAWRAEAGANDELTIERDKAVAAQEYAQTQAHALRRQLYVQFFSRSATAFERDFFALACEYLDRCEPVLRGWEWYWLRQSLGRSRYTLRTGNGASCLDFSPDGDRIVAGCANRNLRMWNTTTGEQVWDRHDQYAFNSVAFDGTGALVASGDSQGRVRLWSAADGQHIRDLPGHRGEAYGVAFHPSGEQIASCGEDGLVRLWDVAQSDEARTFDHEGVAVTCVDISPDGTTIATGTRTGMLRLWNAADGKTTWRTAGHGDAVRELAWSSDGSRIASASDDGTARIWNVATGREVVTFAGHTGSVKGISFHPNSRAILSAGDDGLIKVWDISTGTEQTSLFYHGSKRIRALAVSPDIRAFASAAHDGTVEIWELVHESGVRVLGVDGRTERRTVDFSPDGNQVVADGFDGTLTIWHAQTGEHLLAIRGHQNWVMAAVYSHDGKRIASAGEGSDVHLWDAESGERLGTIQALDQAYITFLAFSPNDRLLATCGDRVVNLWDTDTRERIRALPHQEFGVDGVDFSPDGAHIVTCQTDSDGTVRIWDTATGRVIRSLTRKGHYRGVRYSRSGTYIAAGGFDRAVVVWDSSTGDVMHELRGHGEWVTSVAFTPDEKRVFSVDHGGWMKVWDVATGGELLTLKVHDTGAFCLSVSPDGSTFATTGIDGSVKLWEADSATDRIASTRRSVVNVQ